MNFKYGIVILLIICSFLSAMELDFIKERKYLFWRLSFYFSGYWFIVSFMKYHLGYHKENLLESFWDAGFHTFVHYGIPLIIVAVAAPFVLRILFKENLPHIIRYFDSVLFFALSYTFFFVRKINNKTYCIAFCIAFVITIIAIVFRKYRGEYTGKSEIKKNVIETVPILLHYLVTVVIYTPNELYLNNAADFPMSYWYFFGKLLLSGIIAIAVLMVGMLLYLNQNHMKWYRTILFSVLTIGYIQGLFLNGNMSVLDGTYNNVYNTFQVCFNLCLWVIVISAILFFSWKKYHVAQKFMKAISIWIILIQVTSLGIMVITSKDTAPKSELVITTEGMIEVGEKNNIIVFVLDKFDISYIDEITEESPEFFEPLSDFVFYRNAVSAFCPTYDSIPYLLSGTEFVEDSKIDYVKYAYENDNLLRDINACGYDIGVYTDKRYVAESMKSIIPNYKDGIKRTCNTFDLFALMTQCSRYKMAPFAAKRYYVYDTSDIALLVVSDSIVNIENDLPFYNKLTEDGLRISKSDADGTFRFIHMHGGHPPYTMTEDFQYIEYDSKRDDGWGSNTSQWKGAMKIVYEYMRQLKELGKYDDSLIIITTDHGVTGSLSDEEGNMIEVSCPILFVKEPFETNENLFVSDAPVCHFDMIATIRKQLGVNILDKTLNEISQDEERIRYMYVSTPGLLEKYAITGDSMQINNWQLLFRTSNDLESTH